MHHYNPGQKHVGHSCRNHASTIALKGANISYILQRRYNVPQLPTRIVDSLSKGLPHEDDHSDRADDWRATASTLIFLHANEMNFFENCLSAYNWKRKKMKTESAEKFMTRWKWVCKMTGSPVKVHRRKTVKEVVSEWSISTFTCSLTRNMISHSMKNLAFHSLLR